MPSDELLRENETDTSSQEDAAATGLDGYEDDAAERTAQQDDATSEAPSAKLDRKGREPEGAFMVFDRGAVSIEAKALVGALVDMIEAREQAQGKRQRARGRQRREDLVALVGRFAGELVAAVDRDALPLLPCSKNSNYLLKLDIRYPVFTAVFGGLEGLGLIRAEVAGSHGRWPSAIEELDGDTPSFADPSQIVRGRGRVTRIRPTRALLELVRQHGILPNSASRHFPRLRPPAPLQLRGKSTWVYGDKVRGNVMPIPETPETDRLKAEVQELSAFIRGVKIEGVEGIELTGWTRGFNEGDHEGFAWDRGGRLYGRPGDATYQSLSSAERGRLLLDGEPVVEIDIKASHLHIVYALRGQSLAQHLRELDRSTDSDELDPYQVADLPRAVVKAWVTVTLGAGEPPKKWPRKAIEDLGDLRGYPPAEVGQAVLNRHPALRGLSGISWAKLQFIESQAIVGTMLKLMRDHGIPALPVHDSLIVLRSAYHVADLLLEKEIKSVTGQSPLPFKALTPRTELPRPEDTPYWGFLRENLWDF